MLLRQLVEKEDPLKPLPNSCTLFAQQANFSTRNLLVLSTYSQLESIMNLKFFALTKSNSKITYLVGDSNLNLLDYNASSKVKDLLNITFQNVLILIIKQANESVTNATLIDHILTKTIQNDDNGLTGILKSDISGRYPFLLMSNEQIVNCDKNG